MPALEAWIGGRALAAYAIKRNRYHYLLQLLKRYVCPVTSDYSSKARVPFAFWPFYMRIPMPEGIISFSWQNKIQRLWKNYFGNWEAYLDAACKYEFIIEFNSYIGVGFAGKQAKEWIKQYQPDVDFTYIPDLWRFNLDFTVPVAEKIYEAFKRGRQDIFLVHITVEKSILDSVLEGKSPEGQLDVLTGYLDHLQKWQAKQLMSINRAFPPYFQWGEKLGPLVETFRSKRDSKQAH